MSNSVQTVVSNGSLTLLDLSIEYFDRSHIKVFFDAVEQTLGTTWFWVGATDRKIQFVPAVASGVVVKVQRKTPLDAPRHVYSSPGNAPFNKKTVDENFQQALYAAQEAAEGASLLEFAQDVSAAGYKLTDLGDAMLDGDAVSLRVLREYLPYGPAASSLNARLTAEEAVTANIVKQGTLLSDKVIVGYDASSLPDKALVHFGGLAQVGDGGGGTLRFLKDSVSPANGVTIYAVTGGRMLREGAGVFGIDPRWAGAKSGEDSTAALQAAFNAGKYIRLGDASNAYLVSGTITVQSGTRIESQGGSITQLTDQTPMFDASDTADVEFTGGAYYGKAEAVYNNTPSSQAICIKGDRAARLRVHNNYFQNFWYSPLMVAEGGVSVAFHHNRVVGPGAPVLGVDVNRRNTTGCTIIGTRTLVAFNEVSETSQGVIIGQGSQDFAVFGNFIHDLTNEHGVYADTGLKRGMISDNIIYRTGAHGTGLKVQSYDAFGVASEGVVVANNVISDTGGDGILIDNTSASPTLKTSGVIIKGNCVRRAGAYGIDVRDVEDGCVSDNIVIDAGTSGIAWGGCNNVKFVDNYVRSTLLSGMRDLAPSDNIVVRGNTIKDCAQAVGANDKYGILINDGGVNTTIEDNTIDDAFNKMQYGVFIIPDINSSLVLVNNSVLRASDCGLRLGATTPMREYSGNYWNGTIAATFNDPGLPVVQSAAVITLPQNHGVVSIGNTVNISTIVANGHSGKIVTLVFQGALQVVRGSNLLLNQSLGSFNTSPNDTLTLVCDGVYWYEIGRSSN